MDKPAYIKAVSARRLLWKGPHLARALLKCLSPIEAIATLDLSFEQDPEHRTLVVKRIIADIGSSLLPEHEDLAATLVSTFASLPYRKQQKCAAVMDQLGPSLPIALQCELLSRRLECRYRAIRRMAYKRIYESSHPSILALAHRAWDMHRDLDSARLLIHRGSLDHLVDRLTELEAIATDPKLLHKLYCRAAERNRMYLDLLRERDAIWYVYACAKCGVLMSENEARKLFHAHRAHPEVGIMIFAFGEMGLWSNLVEIADMSDVLLNEELERGLTSVCS